MDYYKITANDGANHSVRPDHSITTTPLVNKITPTVSAKGGTTTADVFVYTADVPNGVGGFYAKKGDTWRHVFDVGGVAVDGWTAEIHLGIRQGITLTLVSSTPPAPIKTVTGMNIQIISGSVTTLYSDGTSITETVS